MSDSDSDNAGIPLIEPLSDSDTAPIPSRHKRKRTTTEDDAPEPQSKRAAKRNKSKKPKDVDDAALDLTLGINHAIAHMDPQLTADHVAQRTKRFQPDLSTVELEDTYIPEKAILDTTDFAENRVAEQLEPFLERFAAPRRKKTGGRKLSDAPTQKGMPHTLVVAGAGLRAADLTRALKNFRTKEAMVAKLFAKHIKLQEAVDTAKKTRMNIGVGTPQRLMDLLDQGALSITHLERIVIDASHIDQKKRGIMDMKDTLVPLVKLLTRKDLKERYVVDTAKKIELLFF